MGRFRPIRSPQYVGSGGSRRKATKADKRKYSKAKGGDLGKLRQERALEAPWDREYRLQQEEMAARDRERKRIEREIERDIAGDEGGRMSTGKARTLAQFVRGMGGINTQTRVKRGRVKYGDLENFTFKGSGSRGLVTTMPGKGLSLDYMHQAAREAGYDVTDIDDLLDRLDDEIRGNAPTYSTKGSMTYNPLPKYEYVYYATKIGDPDWKEVIAISGRPEKLTPERLAKVKAAMKKDGYDRLRMAKIDLSTAPDFGGSVRRNPAAKKNPDAISLFASLAGGVASALSIKQHLEQPVKKAAAKKRGTTKAKTTMRRSNPSDGRQIAATIREQLGGRKFEAMTGAKDFMFGPKYLQFRLPANFARSGINIVKISLTPADLYDVEYMKYGRLNFKTIAVSKGLMFDQLRSDFTAKTGLDTSLGTAGRRNPATKRSEAPKGDLYVLTIGSGDDLISVYLHDGDKDGFSKRFKTLAAAKAYATRNKVKLVDNPAAKKVNGVISRAWARSKAKREYARELRLAAAADRARSRRQKAEAKAKANPLGVKWVKEYCERQLGRPLDLRSVEDMAFYKKQLALIRRLGVRSPREIHESNRAFKKSPGLRGKTSKNNPGSGLRLLGSNGRIYVVTTQNRRIAELIGETSLRSAKAKYHSVLENISGRTYRDKAMAVAASIPNVRVITAPKTNPNSVPRCRTFEMFQGRPATTAKATANPAGKGMTLAQIKKAVNAGKTVHWSNDAYKVIKDNRGQYLIMHSNGSGIGLTWADDKTLNGKEKDFYIGKPAKANPKASAKRPVSARKNPKIIRLPAGFKWEKTVNLATGGDYFNILDPQGLIVGWGVNKTNALKTFKTIGSRVRAGRGFSKARAKTIRDASRSLKIAVRNPKAAAIPKRRTFEMFQGRPATTAKALPVSRHAPARLDQLGDLIEIKLHGGRVLKFNGAKAKLCASGGKLWIAGTKIAKANPAAKANEIDAIDAIDHVVYGTRKPHHGDHKYTHYIHRLGEESGLMPTLCVDREGFPIIRGGNYKIEARGIVD